jgi:hypothetical protein
MNTNNSNQNKIFKKIIKENNFKYLNKFIDYYFSKQELNIFLKKYKDFLKYEDFKKIKVFFIIKNIKTDNSFDFEIDKNSFELKILEFEEEFKNLEKDENNNKLNKINNQIKENNFEINELDLI